MFWLLWKTADRFFKAVENSLQVQFRGYVQHGPKDFAPFHFIVLYFGLPLFYIYIQDSYLPIQPPSTQMTSPET